MHNRNSWIFLWGLTSAATKGCVKMANSYLRKMLKPFLIQHFNNHTSEIQQAFWNNLTVGNFHYLIDRLMVRKSSSYSAVFVSALDTDPEAWVDPLLARGRKKIAQKNNQSPPSKGHGVFTTGGSGRLSIKTKKYEINMWFFPHWQGDLDLLVLKSNKMYVVFVHDNCYKKSVATRI